jgi:O-antigen ligase
MQPVPTVKKRMQGLLLAAVLVGLSVEYVELPGELSVFRLLVLPACALGLLSYRAEPISRHARLALLLLAPLPLLHVPTVAHAGDPTVLTTALGVSIFVAYFVLALSKEGTQKYILACMAIWGIPHVFVGITDAIGFTSLGRDANAFRFDGLHSDPNLMGLFLLLACTATFEWLRTTKSRCVIGCLGLYLSAMVLLVLLSASRGTMLGLLLLVAVVLYRWIGIRAVGVVSLPVVALVLFLERVGPALLQIDPRQSPWLNLLYRLAVLREATESSPAAISRWGIWQDALRQIRADPWFAGSGTRQFVETYGHYPHSSVLDAYLDMGKLGGSYFLLLLAGVAAVLFCAMIRSHNRTSFSHVLFISSLPMTFFLSCFASKAYWVMLCVSALAAAQLLLSPTMSFTTAPQPTDHDR